MKCRSNWLIGLALSGSVVLGGCASVTYDENRTITEQRPVERPKDNDPTGYQSLQIAWGKLTDDRASIPFMISQQSVFDQFNQATQVTQSRTNMHSEMACRRATSCRLAYFFASATRRTA